MLFRVLTGIKCINVSLRVSQTAHRLTINFERNSEIVTLSGTDGRAMFTFTIYNTINCRGGAPPPCLKKIGSVYGSF